MEQLCNPWDKVAPWHICSSSDFISSDLIETAVFSYFELKNTYFLINKGY